MDEAAAGLRNIHGDLNTQISRGSVPALPLKDTMNAQASADTSMTMSALKTLVSEARGNAEKVKFTTFKNAGTGKDETPVEDIAWTWEIEFSSSNIEPSVSRVLGLMTPGGNLRSWADTFRSVTRDTKDPNDISNWTWQRFRNELYASSMYSPPDKKKILDTFDNVTCSEPGTPEQLTEFTHAFLLALQDLRRIGLHEQFSIASQAQKFYNKLPKLVTQHMALRDPMRKDPELRDNLSELQQEVREVMQWSVYKNAVSQATHGRAMGAMGVLVSGDSDKRPKRIAPQEGESMKFTTSVTPQSTAWLDHHAVMRLGSNADTLWWVLIRANLRTSSLVLLTRLVLFLLIRKRVLQV